uniref:Hippurate hydrolase n=1 Tax=Candidatus Kentrum sp. LFY TaxID=2126342 RepID=A0A450UR39_9GAMM|nr:MAG: hippurate hydrolase [Candidatus Kentron sp. LFY]
MKPRSYFLSFLLFFCLINPAMANDSATWAKENLSELVEFYRYLHAHPELSFQEKQTSARLASEFAALGARVTPRVGGYGVVALLENGDGPTVMMRTDMDALPIVEETKLAYASRIKVEDSNGAEVGAMHACGHDVHMTNLVGVARYLAARKDTWNGTAMFVSQPAEEYGAGAKAMLDDGLFQRFPEPDYALAMHVGSDVATGKIEYRPGYSHANVDTVGVTMIGRGGHGARPHTAIDPVVLAARLVLDLQTIVSREIKPIDPAVITVGSIHGGTKSNIIGDTCDLQLTVRSYSDKVRAHLLEAIGRKAKAVATGARAPEPKITISEGVPSLRNDEALVDRILPVFHRVVGAENVQLTEPTMGGEDFGRYGYAGVPIFMWRMGAVNEDRLAGWKSREVAPPSLHSPLFYPDIEETLRTSVPAMASAALELLQSKR